MYNIIYGHYKRKHFPAPSVKTAKSFPLPSVKKPQIKRAYTLDPTGRFTADQKAKIKKFEENKELYINELLKHIIITQRPRRNSIYYYFIGRLNPPHEGHIAALLNLIIHAIDTGGLAIILLGSGPNGGVQTSKDPISFDDKKKVITNILKPRLTQRYPTFNINGMFEPNGQIQIIEMGKPSDQIKNIIEEDIPNLILLDKIFTFRISGDKEGGEDIKKLAWIEKAIISAGIINKNGDIIPIITDVIPEPAVQIEGEGEAMSATQVREDAWTMTLEEFAKKYGKFYGFDTELIFQAIREYKPKPLQIAAVTLKTRKLTPDEKKIVGIPRLKSIKSKKNPEGGGYRKRRKTRRKLIRQRKTRRKSVK